MCVSLRSPHQFHRPRFIQVRFAVDDLKCFLGWVPRNIQNIVSFKKSREKLHMDLSFLQQCPSCDVSHSFEVKPRSGSVWATQKAQSDPEDTACLYLNHINICLYVLHI